MRSKFVFQIKPVAHAAARLADYIHNNDTRGVATKMRRTSHLWKTPLTYAPIEITVNEPGERSGQQALSFTCIADPAEYLVGVKALTDNVVGAPARHFLRLFKAWLKEMFADITEDLLASITDDHCQLSTVTGSYYFKFDDATKAFEALHTIHLHAKVMLDASAPYPGSRAAPKTPTPRVRADAEDRQAFQIDLSHLPNGENFGSVRVSLMHEKSAQPKSFGAEKLQQRERLRAHARCLLCFDVQVDVGKTLHFGEDQNFKLPSDIRHWTKEKFPQNPFKIIWEAARYALWLNLPLATDEVEASRENLKFGSGEVLDAYFLGKNLRLNEWIDSDDEAHKKFRRYLIEHAKVDILVPWEIAKLNKSAVLGPILSYEDRFQPGSDPDFSAYTLSQHNVDAAITDLGRKLPEFSVAEEPWPLPTDKAKEIEGDADE